MSDEVADITIIGAGPVGLSTAFWAGMRGASCRIVDALPEIGGQCTALYPEKWIYDVPGHPRILARELVERLGEQALGQFDVPVHLDCTAHRLERAGDELALHTDDGELRSRTLIVAGGHGAFEPRRLPASDVDMAPWESRGAHYVVADKAELAGRDVVVVGGGDSALDWVLNLLDVAGEITLVHRRERFRAHEATVAQVLDQVEAGRVRLRVPAVLRAVEGDAAVRAVVVEDRETGATERLACEAVLLQLGFVTRLGPLREWGFEIEKGALSVDQQMRTNLEKVWAVGDVATYDGKLKLIATGFAEAATAVAQAVRAIRPGTALQPAYSTNTGVPGVVAGQV